MSIRQRILERNQPVEFYARVIDQNAQPVEGAKLTLKLSRVDEKFFETTNFFHKELGEEMTNETINLVSDDQGWMQSKGVTGFSLDVNRLEKEGYISKYTNIYHGGVHYEPGSRRNPSGDILMTNAFNPAKGYTFHLWKKGQTERVVPWKKTYQIKREVPEQAIGLFPTIEGQTAYPDLLLKTPLAHPEIHEGNSAYDRWIILEAGADAASKETAMVYAYSAPRDGYGRDFRFLYQPRTREGEGWTRRFYVKARNGKVFASLTVNFSSASGLNLHVDAIVNPNGSRNLEPDPEKLITDLEEIGRLNGQTRR